MAYNDDKIKIDASLKNLNSKIKTDISSTEEKIYWYIKFSVSLDETSVSTKTMSVTDINGYIFKTEIIYNKKLELIVIEPIDKYKEEEYYILHITKKVRSKNLKNLKKNIHILFKIKEGEISEFKELGENVVVPKPKRPTRKVLEDRKPTKSKVYEFQRKNSKKSIMQPDSDKLPFTNIKFNPLLGIIGMPILLIGIFLQTKVVILLGAIMAIVGFIHMIIQIYNKDFRSNFFYNLGALNFNKEKYKKADKFLKKALNLNNKNEFAEYGINKVSFFL